LSRGTNAPCLSDAPALWGWGFALLGLSVVAAAGSRLMGLMLGNPREKRLEPADNGEGNPIPYEKRLELVSKYGRWAVDTAIGVCPRGDVECVEREARRLAQVRWRR